jgi:hypothetical protein
LASTTAVSSASLPLLVKKLFLSLPGDSRASFSATSICRVVGYRVEVWPSSRICAVTASLTSGLACPIETVRMPPKKSRYSWPSMSVTRLPDPWVSTTGSL